MRAGPIGLALLLLACGSALRGGVTFDGRTAPAVVEPDGIAELVTLPSTHRRLGTASAACTLEEPFGAVQGAWLSDVDCREGRLRAALRERAAAAGGQALVGVECRSEPRGSGVEGRRRRLSCRADVARVRSDAAPHPAVPDVAAERQRWLGRASASEAWSIRVDFTPEVGAKPRAPRHPDSVRERALIPPSHVRLGSVIARCDAGCTEAGAFDALLATAARAGATDVTEVACGARGGGFVCVATAIGHRDDLEATLAAR
jgi:hypothetical protein